MEYLIVPLFLVAFPAIWCGVLFLLSRMSGWNVLAQHYRLRETFQGPTKGFQSAQIGYSAWFPVQFRNALTVGAEPGHLYLKPMFIFAVFQPALLIPMKETTCEVRQGVFLKRAHLRTEKAPGVLIMLPEGLLHWVEETAGGLDISSR